MKIVSYNINGIRAAIKKNFLNWIKTSSPDVICLQEIKANPTQFNPTDFESLGYHCFWYPAKRKGYSGVAILSKIKPKNVIWGCGHKAFDNEGRVLKAEYKNLNIFSCYFPSGSSGELRQKFKMDFLKARGYIYFGVLHHGKPIRHAILYTMGSGMNKKLAQYLSTFK